MDAELPLPKDVWARTPPEAQALIRTRLAAVAALQANVVKLERRVQQLEGAGRRTGKDAKRKPPKPPAGGAGRKPGGQAGHPKHERPLVPREQVAQTISIKPPKCSGCGGALAGADPSPRRHQVADIPPVRPTVVEY